MNLFGVMDISASALRAERVRAEVVASNMANAETTKTIDGGPYRRHHVIFEAQEGQSFSTALLNQGLLPRDAASSRSPNMILMGSDEELVPNGGVAIRGVIEDASAPLRRYDPMHPDAGVDGYVSVPDINPLTEMVDLMGATRSYGMNASAVQAEKNMITSSLELLK